MPKNKDHTEPLQTTEELLEARVDAMMDVKAEKPATESTPALNIFADAAPGAPLLTQPVAEAEVAEAPDEQQTAPPSFVDEQPLEPAELDTEQSDAAIDDIVAQEADQVLAAEDAGILAAQASAEDATQPPQKHGHPIFWFGILLLVAIAVIAAVMLTSPGLNLPFLQ